MRLLRTGKRPPFLFHDFHQGQPARKFVEQHWRGAFFSDDPAFAVHLRELNSRIGRDPNSKTRRCSFCMPARWSARALFDLVVSDSLGASGLDSSWQDHEPASTLPLTLVVPTLPGPYSLEKIWSAFPASLCFRYRATCPCLESFTGLACVKHCTIGPAIRIIARSEICRRAKRRGKSRPDFF